MASLSEAQSAARAAAKHAATLYKAIVVRPAPAPAPAGHGIELKGFREALPLFRWRELQEFASVFGHRSCVVTDIGRALANEVSRRLTSAYTCLESSAPPLPSALRPRTHEEFNEDDEDDEVSGQVRLLLRGIAAQPESRKPWEVASVSYNFSKLAPQLPEYKRMYAVVSEGIRQEVWTFTRLQLGLVGTAFADAGVHLDILPELLRRALVGLHEHEEEITADELRYLLHICAHFPSTGASLPTADAELLASCTSKIVKAANFAKTAHIAIGWLQAPVATGAKASHLKALNAACMRLLDTSDSGISPKPTLPAHPLPPQGLGPTVATLISREKNERTDPPLTRTRLKAIVFALMQISRGLLSVQSSRTRLAETQALSLADWVLILQEVFQFCVHYDRLPGWAAEALGFVTSRVNVLPHNGAPRPESLLILLRLCRNYKPKPAPSEQFYEWIAQRLLEWRWESGHSSLLAEAVRELVPCLPDSKREAIEGALHNDSVASTSGFIALPSGEDDAGIRRPLLSGSVWLPRDRRAILSLKSSGSGSASLIASSRALRGSSPSLSGELRHEAGSIAWRLLANSEDSIATSPLENLTLSPSHRAGDGTHDEMAKETGTYPQPLSHLDVRLQTALERVEALEARLESRLKTLAAKANEEKLGCPPNSLASECKSPEAEAAAAEPSGQTWQFQRPFSFEEFRRANSSRLQSERLRVLLPPSRISVVPYTKR